MTPTTYEERRDELALKSSVLVQVILGTARTDAEFVPLKPKPATAEMHEELRQRWAGRGLRAVGFIGIVDGAPQLVSNEPLDEMQVEALSTAFGVYVGTLLRGATNDNPIVAEIERAQGAELEREHMERICALPFPPSSSLIH